MAMERRVSGWTQFSRTIAAIFGLLFVLSLVPAMLLRSAASVAFTPVALQRSLDRRLLQSGALRSAVLQSILPDPISSDQDSADELGFITANLEVEDWEEISRIAIPDDWLRDQLAVVVNGLYAWLDGDELSPALELNAEPVKRRLLGQGSERILEIILLSWPECTAEQVEAIQVEFHSRGGISLLGCAPPEPFRTVTLELAADAFQYEARQLPSRVPLIEDLSEEAGNLLELKTALLQIRAVARWGVMIPLAMLGLIMALAVRSWSAWARWWGFPLLSGGVLTDLVSAVLRRWMLLGGLVGVVGLILIAIGSLIRGSPDSIEPLRSATSQPETPSAAESGMFT
jgi:hypothetical protein